MDDWLTGVPCEPDGISFCSRCKPKPFPVDVIITDGGSAFHRSADCYGLQAGQDAAEHLGQIVHETRFVHREVALSKGYLPCLLCFPEARGHA